MNNRFDYLKESERTLSGSFYGDKIPYHSTVQALEKFTIIAGVLDQIKKGIFYGKNIDKDGITPYNCESFKDNKDLFHAVIGIATEAGELVEAFLRSINSASGIDKVNLAEEVGDSFWYAAIIAREAGLTFEEIQHTNIAKLKARFPEKFSELHAIHSDLATEREILEVGSKPVELPQSIQAEVGCISKAKLIEALEAISEGAGVELMGAEKSAEWIFKNYA